MGSGVVDPHGGSPASKWESRIRLILSDRLQDVALSLLSGDVLTSNDNDVQLAWTAFAGNRGEMRIRDADEAIEFFLSVSLEALSDREIGELAEPDPRGHAIIPDAWTLIQSESSARWELFNCRVLSVFLGRA